MILYHDPLSDTRSLHVPTDTDLAPSQKGASRELSDSTARKLIGEDDDSGQQIGHNISLLGITRSVHCDVPCGCQNSCDAAWSLTRNTETLTVVPGFMNCCSTQTLWRNTAIAL